MNETEARKTFEDDMRRLSYDVIGASEHYNIWYIYQNDCDRPKYVDVMNHYLNFFAPSISAQFTAMVLNLSKFFDKNRQAISIYSLMQRGESHNLIDASLLQEIKSELDEAEKGSIEKLRNLRNNVFAHMGKLDSTKAFKRAGLSPKDLRELIEFSEKTLEKIYYAYDRNSLIFELDSKKDTYSLLNDLLRLNSK